MILAGCGCRRDLVTGNKRIRGASVFNEKQMASEATHTITLPSGEQQQVTPVTNMIGQLVGYDVFAITPTGDLRLVHSKVGEHYYKEKVEGGLLGGLTRAMQLDDRSIIEKYNRDAHANNPSEALQRDRELYQYREKNIKDMSSKPDGLLWDPETGALRRLDNYTSVKLLNENINKAAKQGVFGKPNDQGLYFDPANPNLPPSPLPQYSVNNLANPQQGGFNSAYAQQDFFGVQGKGGNKGQPMFAGTKPKRFGRLFGAASVSQGGLELDNSGVRSSTTSGMGPAYDSTLEDILRTQATKMGANPNITPNDPFFLSYAFRRTRPELSQQIMQDEHCDMSVNELTTYYRNVDLKDKAFNATNYENNPLTGVTMTLEEPSTRANYLAKQVNPNAWSGKEIEVIRRMISTGPYTQAFQGFAEDPKSKNLLAIFERPRMGITDYLKSQTMTDDLFKRIFSAVLRAMCHLESIGLHHPDITDSALKFMDNDLASLKLSNPFLYENFYQEIITVYLNNFNTVHGIAAFNKRYLQENVMELFCCLLCIVLRSSFTTYSPSMGQFNGPEILKGLETVRRMCSPYVADLLSRYLMTPMERLPTPIQLAYQEGVSVDYNSYYGHSKLNRPLYYPFEKFTGMKKASPTQSKTNPPPFAGRIPHWSEIDYYKGDDLNESRQMGVAHRKRNFVVEEGNVNNSVLKPYNITLRDVELNENVLLGSNEGPLGRKNMDQYVPPAPEQGHFSNQVNIAAQRPAPPVAQSPSPTFGTARIIGGGGYSPYDSPLPGLSPILAPNQQTYAAPRPAYITPQPASGYRPLISLPLVPQQQTTYSAAGARLENSQLLPVRLEPAGQTRSYTQAAPAYGQALQSGYSAQAPSYAQISAPRYA